MQKQRFYLSDTSHEQPKHMSKINEATVNGCYYREWACLDEPKGIVLLVHGLGEHCERYNKLGAVLNQAGYDLSALDLPSHGRSEGRRGHINAFSDFNDAVIKLYDLIKEAHPNTPIHLLGHSMGGLIASSVLLDHQDKFTSAMLSGAAIQSPQQPPDWQVSLISTIAKFAPKLGMLALDASGISKDPAVVEKYMADPLVSKDKLSARFLVEMFATMNRVVENAETINLPILIMHGTEDVMTAPAGSQLLYDTISSSDKSLKFYSGLLHEIFNEPEVDIVHFDVLNWLNDH